VRTTLLTVLTLTVGLTASGACAQATTSSDGAWSADSGASLFQSLGISLPNQEARSQILPSSSYSTSYPSNFPANFLAARNLSVSPPSTDRDPALGKMAGPSSAPPPSASFVPQIAQKGGGADPVLVEQSQPLIIKMEVPMKIPKSGYWGNILGHYTISNSDGLTQFDYAALKASKTDTAMLANYVGHLTTQKPSNMSSAEAMAYWANLYNALTVQVVAENYPVTSIRKIKSGFRAGPWKRTLVTVEGKELSLDNIEHDIMRPTFNTPLVHYMVNCASIGCPNLNTEAWQSVGLEGELDMAARAYINSPRGVAIVKGRLQVSSIYKWFEKDFGGNQAGVLTHLRKYANDDLLAKLEGRSKIDKYAYDWGVNAPK